jgi:hypothetical protein
MLHARVALRLADQPEFDCYLKTVARCLSSITVNRDAGKDAMNL